MFCLSEQFPLGAKGLMMYNPSWRFYGRASQSKHFFPLFYITLTNRNAEPFNYRDCLTHPESQIFWQHLAEGKICTEFPELLVKTMTPRKLINDLVGPTVDAMVHQSGPYGSVSAPLALQQHIPGWWYFDIRPSSEDRMSIGQKNKGQAHMSWAHLCFTETSRIKDCTLNSQTNSQKESIPIQLNISPLNSRIWDNPNTMHECTRTLYPVVFRRANT